MNCPIDAPALYVGTYQKYNEGSIAGEWVDLSQHDKESFYEYCKELHKDEDDPELMFQDFQNFPKAYYGESGCDDQLWEWLDLDSRDQEIVAAYVDYFGVPDDINTPTECYAGEFDSDVDFAWDYSDSTGMLDSIPENLKGYFDMESFARDLMMDVTASDGFYFYSH